MTKCERLENESYGDVLKRLGFNTDFEKKCFGPLTQEELKKLEFRLSCDPMKTPFRKGKEIDGKV